MKRSAADDAAQRAKKAKPRADGALASQKKAATRGDADGSAAAKPKKKALAARSDASGAAALPPPPAAATTQKRKKASAGELCRAQPPTPPSLEEDVYDEAYGYGGHRRVRSRRCCYLARSRGSASSVSSP